MATVYNSKSPGAKILKDGKVIEVTKAKEAEVKANKEEAETAKAEGRQRTSGTTKKDTSK